MLKGRRSGFARVAALQALTSIVLSSAPALAATLGTGSFYLQVEGDPTNNNHCFQVTPYANQTYHVFGVDVNLNTSVGTLVCIGSVVNGVSQGLGTHCESYPDPSAMSFNIVNGSLLCRDTTCGPFSPWSFVAESVIAPSGTVVSSLGPSVTYAFDADFDTTGTVTAIPNCTLAGGFRFAGTATQSAFQVQTVSTGPDQTVTFPATTFVNPITGQEVSFDVSMNFADVSGGGTTTVTATSNSAGAIDANFAASVNGFQAAFLEITTTAAVTPPITICSTYPDVDNDGYLDGTSPAVPESALSFLHGEGDPVTFVDRTASRDADNNVICAQVDSLSPFAVLIRTNGLCASEGAPCDDGDACTENDACNASLACVGGNAVTCEDSNPCTTSACVSPGGCVHSPAPATGCNTSNAKSVLVIQDSSTNSKDQLLFKWLKGASALSEFGDPQAATDYTICAYDANKLLASATAPAAATCGTHPCWSLLGPSAAPKGVKYTDGQAANQGVKLVNGKADTTGKSNVLFKAQGINMPPIDLDAIGYPVTVQIRTTDAGCWEQQFVAGDEKKNDGSKFKAVHVGP